MKIYTCQMCGKEFESDATKAKYCADCRVIKQRERQNAYYRRKKTEGTEKAVGSTAICADCGSPFTRSSASQKVCENCRKKHLNKTNQKHVQKYMAENYDILHCYVDKAEGQKIREAAALYGLSLSAICKHGLELVLKEIEKFEAEAAEKEEPNE